MRRREFITLLSAAAAALPLVSRAQQPAKLPTIGFLGPTSASIASERIAAFTQRLHELGWIEGQTVTIQYRWAEDKPDRFKQIATEFVRLRVDIIATWGTATALAAKQATSDIPIVFTIVSDPVGSGLINSLARPGGNVTGLSTEQVDIAGKRLEVVREIVPTLNRLAILANVDNPGAIREMQEVLKATQALGLQVIELEIRQAQDIEPTLAKLHGEAQALFVTSDALVNSNRDRINSMALRARVPTIYGWRDPIEAGGLMSYGPSYPDLFRRQADYVDKIIRGAKPADLPVEQPTKFDLVINLKTAKALGITVPPTLLVRADEVIE